MENQYIVFSSTCRLVIQVKNKLLTLWYINTGTHSEATEWCDYILWHRSYQSLHHENELLVHLSPFSALNGHERCLSIQKHRPFSPRKTRRLSKEQRTEQGGPTGYLADFVVPDKKIPSSLYLAPQEPLRCRWRQGAEARAASAESTVNSTRSEREPKNPKTTRNLDTKNDKRKGNCPLSSYKPVLKSPSFL